MSAYADSIARQERAKAYAAQAHDPIICPKCDGNLDTGFECLGCGYDAAPVTQPATSQEDDGTYPFWPERPGYAAGIIREPGTDPDDGTATTQEGEAIDYAEAARVMFEACRDRFMRAEQCYVAIDALAAAGFLAATPTPPTLSEDLREAEVEQFINAGFATVSRNPSDHETAVAYREAVRLALAHSGARS